MSFSQYTPFFRVQPESKKQLSLPLESISKLGCNACTLNKITLIHPKMDATGDTDPLFYFFAEAPGSTEDELGEQLIGESGQMIRTRIPSKWKKRIRWNNTANCRPPLNRDPSPLELACCRPRMEKDIMEAKPAVVVGFGRFALQWVTGETTMHLWRGRRLVQQLHGHPFWFYPITHPSAILHSGGYHTNNLDLPVFANDLKRVFQEVEELDDPVVITPEQMQKNIRCLSGNAKDWPDIIKDFCRKNKKGIGYDIETNNLRPYPNEAAILSVALATTDNGITFPIAHPEARLKPETQMALLAAVRDELPGIDWVAAHNAAFEQEWGLKFLGMESTKATKWKDTQAQAFTLDERQKMHSLDTISFIHLGLRIKELHDVYVEHLDQEPLVKVLPYNAGDSRACAFIYPILAAEIEHQGMVGISDMHQRRSLTMARLKYRGVVPDIVEAKRLDKEVENKVNLVLNDIAEHTKGHIRRHGRFNPNTAADVKRWFLEEMHQDLPSTGEEYLSLSPHPFAQAVLDYRTLTKLRSTYLAKIISGEHIWPDGRLHSLYSQLRARSGRLASSEPNLQNIPKRGHKEIRGVIGVPKGCVLASFDYGQIEARVIAMASKDKFLCKALWDGYDIHAHWTERLAKADKRWGKGAGDKKVFKLLRDHVKNEWTFPAFFGAQLGAVASYLGIDDRTLEPLYIEFWEQFAGVKQWQEKVLSFYNTNLYVEMLTGRRRHGPLTANQLFNTPIQGPASDIVVDAMERLDDLSDEHEKPW